MTEAFSFLLKLSRDIVTPFLQSGFFQSWHVMVLQRFVHCCNAKPHTKKVKSFSFLWSRQYDAINSKLDFTSSLLSKVLLCVVKDTLPFMWKLQLKFIFWSIFFYFFMFSFLFLTWHHRKNCITSQGLEPLLWKIYPKYVAWKCSKAVTFWAGNWSRNWPPLASPLRVTPSAVYLHPLSGI